MTSPLEQKKIKITGPVVVTANRVGDGAVVYRRADGGWTTQLDDAAVATDAARARAADRGRDRRRSARGRRLCRAGQACCRTAMCGREICASSSALAGPTIDLPADAIGTQAPESSSRRMYVYDDFDRTLVAERVAEFRDQVARRLSGELTEEEFKPLRLMNGVYLQLHAYMLRIAIPYGTLSSAQLRMLAHVARRYDRGYGHFTTRQNIQFHWIKLEELPDAMADLASVGMHGMQTSGNCVRNITTDQWAGVAPDEIEDPRIWAEIIRQHVTLHPEFSFLPRKFKIAVGASSHDRAALRIHDLALRLHRNDAGEIGFEVMVGGGLGRTPFLAKTIKPFLHQARRAELCRGDAAHLQPVRPARQYLQGAHQDPGARARRRSFRQGGRGRMAKHQGRRAGARSAPSSPRSPAASAIRLTSGSTTVRRSSPRRAAPTAVSTPGSSNSVANHKVPGYAIVTLSLKPEGGTPGDATAEQMDAIADLADRYSFGEIRVGHEQNLVLPHVAQRDLPALWRALDAHRRRHAECRSRLRHHLLPRPRLLQPRQCALDPDRAGDHAALPQSRSRSAISAGCTSTSPAASMPAAIIMSAISAFSASRRTARSSIRSRSAARPTRMPSSAR